MKPAKQYNTAVEQLNQGDYQQAIDSFESLDGYKDSADMVLQTKYKWAESLLADKAYDEAYAKFEEIKDYSDAADRMKDVRYTEAENNLMSKVQQEDSTEELPQVEEKTIDEAEKEPGVVMGKESTKGELTGVSPENGTTQAVPHEKVFPTAISISPNEITTRVLYTPTLAVTLSPENTTETDLTWTSSNTDVATVYASGLVLAGSVGETTITVTTVNGLTATCKVVVEESVFPDSIAMKEANVTMKVGETHAMEVLYTPKNTTMRGGTWESSNTAVATVDGKGVVSAVGEGTSVITHRMTWKSLSTSCNVIVSAPNNAANQVEKAPNSSKEIYSENDSVCISNNNPNWTAAEKAKVSPQFHGTWSRSYCDEGGEPVDTPYTWIIDLNEGVYERLNPDGSIDGWGYLIATSDPKELDADGVVAIGKLISDSEIFYRRIWPDSSWTDSTFKKISSVASVSGQLPVAKRGF